MDLRKYAKKRVDTKRVLDCEYRYCSHSRTEYGRPYLTITIEKNECTSFFPGYAVLLILDSSGKIEEIMRLVVMFGTGSKIKKFPGSLEEKAEKLLDEIVVSASAMDASDLSILHDIHLQHLH